MEGTRGGYLVVSTEDASQTPAITEPLYLEVGATVHMQPVMTPEDLRGPPVPRRRRLTPRTVLLPGGHPDPALTRQRRVPRRRFEPMSPKASRRRSSATSRRTATPLISIVARKATPAIVRLARAQACTSRDNTRHPRRPPASSPCARRPRGRALRRACGTFRSARAASARRRPEPHPGAGQAAGYPVSASTSVPPAGRRTARNDSSGLLPPRTDPWESLDADK